MDTDQILDSVELMAGVDRDGARLAVDATLLTLAERVGRAAAAGLAGGLPGELEAALTAGPDAGEPFDAEEFARRTAVRARVDPGRGREYATAVLATLREDVAGIQELRDRLPAAVRLGVGVALESGGRGAPRPTCCLAAAGRLVVAAPAGDRAGRRPGRQ